MISEKRVIFSLIMVTLNLLIFNLIKKKKEYTKNRYKFRIRD